MRVTLDTNVLLSGLFIRGVCEAVLDACIGSDDCVIVLSEHILNEFDRHARDKFRISRNDVRQALKFLRGQAELVTPAEITISACRDPEDLPVLGTLVAGQADCLVTGDKDLLVLGEFNGHPILSPRQFYERLT